MSSLTNKLLLLSIILLVILQWHNLIYFPTTRGFDATGHIEYINFLKTQKRIPLPYEGWELWQPPLYYLTASFFPNIPSVKIIGFTVWLVLLVISYFFFKKFFKDKFLSLIGTIIVISPPVGIYLTPTISNELFSAGLISIALVYYLTKKNKLFLGILLGLAIIAKATAFLLMAAIIIDQLIKYKSNLAKVLKYLVIILAATTLIGGWFYLRNIFLFGNPFAASFDFPQKHPLTQPRVARDFRFFIDISGFLTMDLFRSQYYSFLSGTYFSWFYDGHNVLIPPQPFSKAGALLVVISLPIFFLSLKGFLQEIQQVNNNNRVLILYLLFLLTSYLLYNFKLPFHSTVKGSFLVSAIIPFGYFFLKGINSFMNLINLKNLITLYLFIYCLLIVKNFWILPHWY